MKSFIIFSIFICSLKCYSQNHYYHYHKTNDQEGILNIGMDKRSLESLLKNVNNLHLKDSIVSIMFYLKIDEKGDIKKDEIKYWTQIEASKPILQQSISTYFEKSEFRFFDETSQVNRLPKEVLLSFTIFRAYYVKEQFYISTKFKIKSKFPVGWALPRFEIKPQNINIE
jgi:hypothetical protein